MSDPMVIGRGDHGELDERAATRWRGSVTHEFVSGAVGDVKAELFESVDDEDRGGAVLRLRVRDDGSAMFPWARNIPGGVELHLGGEAEAEAMCIALIQVLALRGCRTMLPTSQISVAMLSEPGVL